MKHINQDAHSAEYAISMRACAHGSGAALAGTNAILRIAFCSLNLENVYLNVLADNGRANAFYHKAGFSLVRTEHNALTIDKILHDLNWYNIHRDNWLHSATG